MILYLAETSYQWLLFKNYGPIIGLVSLSLVKVNLVQYQINTINKGIPLRWDSKIKIAELLKL